MAIAAPSFANTQATWAPAASSICNRNARGTVEGFTWPYYDGFTAFGWQEVSKYLINHPLYRNGIGINMNLAKWNSLPKDLQDIIHEAVAATQSWSLGWVAAHQAVQLKAMVKGGMEVINFSDAEADQWANTTNDALWAHFKSAMSAGDYAEARKLMGYK